MQTKQKSIENFKKYIDELISSSYILSDKKLTDLMRSISSSKLFYTLFEFCTEDFDYEDAFQKAFVKGDGYGNGKFILPSDQKTQIALIFCLLYKINTKELDFLNVLDDYFFVNNYNESYRNFTMQVLWPFRSVVLKTVETMAEDDAVLAREPVVVKKGKCSIKEKDVKEIISLLDESRSVILQYHMESAQKAELIDLYSNFKDSLYDSEPSKIRLAFLGYKYATLFHRKLDNTFYRIQSLLKSNNVL